MNNCILSGNLGNDPEVFYSQEGNPVASFNLAFPSGKKTGWIKVTSFQKLAEIVEEHLKTGNHVVVSGSLDHETIGEHFNKEQTDKKRRGANEQIQRKSLYQHLLQNLHREF